MQSTDFEVFSRPALSSGPFNAVFFFCGTDVAHPATHVWLFYLWYSYSEALVPFFHSVVPPSWIPPTFPDKRRFVALPAIVFALVCTIVVTLIVEFAYMCALLPATPVGLPVALCLALLAPVVFPFPSSFLWALCFYLSLFVPSLSLALAPSPSCFPGGPPFCAQACCGDIISPSRLSVLR